MGGGRSWPEPAGQSWLEQGLAEAWRRSHDCRQLQQEWLADDALRESGLGERPATRSPSALFLTRGVRLGPTEGSGGPDKAVALRRFRGFPGRAIGRELSLQRKRRKKSGGFVGSIMDVDVPEKR